MYPDDFLRRKLDERISKQSLRSLQLPIGRTDFCSNDYLGIATNHLLKDVNAIQRSGSAGSRLLAGNYPLIVEVEKQIASFHQSEAALIFNSGYDANVGLLSCVPQKGDTILYDYLSHASIRDGIRLSFAQSYSFAHNDLNDLEKKISQATGTIFIVTESVFSMDGDTCPIAELVNISKRYNGHLIIDEAHATGVVGQQGVGLVQETRFEKDFFARVHTFGKACGCHGAAVLGSEQLRTYLINFARSLMYSTALPEHAVAMIQQSYNLFPSMDQERKHLRDLIDLFQSASIRYEKLVSQTPIQGIIVPGNKEVKLLAEQLQQKNFDVRPILYPTVPEGKERLRIVLHSFNTSEELIDLLQALR
jgi:8-amino-7-oxononanoate synthase